MPNILYLHRGKGQAAFCIRVENGPKGMKAIHGKLQFGRGFLCIANPVVRATGYSTRKLNGAGYEAVCSLGDEVEVLSCFHRETPMPEPVRKTIIAWLSRKRLEPETKTGKGEADLIGDPPPRPSPSINPWDW